MSPPYFEQFLITGFTASLPNNPRHDQFLSIRWQVYQILDLHMRHQVIKHSMLFRRNGL